MRAPVTAYLDTNAILDLFPRPGTNLSPHENRRRDTFAREARRLLKLRAAQHRIRLSATPILFQELARHSQSDPDRYLRIVEFARPLYGRRVFLDGPLLIAEEFRRAGPVPSPARYADREHITRFWIAATRPSFLAQVVPLARAEAHQYAKQHEALRDSVMPAIHGVKRRPNESLHQALWRWWSADGLTLVRDMAADSVRDLAADMAGSDYPRSFPVERLTAFWYSFSYRLARVVLDIAEQRQIKPSDYADPLHYVTGAYSDVLVTDDVTLHDVHARQPWSTVRPLRLAAFMADYLA